MRYFYVWYIEKMSKGMWKFVKQIGMWAFFVILYKIWNGRYGGVEVGGTLCIKIKFWCYSNSKSSYEINHSITVITPGELYVYRLKVAHLFFLYFST